MATYANGLIPDAALVALSTVGRLPAEAAASYERMRAAALRDGVNLRPTSSADAHRTRAQQERLFFERYVPYNTGTGDRRFYNGRGYWRRPRVASAAVPGTSNHGNEDPAALDLTGLGGFGGDGYLWLAAHAAEYGWENPDWARNPRAGATEEPWHWEYSRTRDKHRGSGGGAAAIPIPTPAPVVVPDVQEDDEMFRIRVAEKTDGVANKSGQAIFLCRFGSKADAVFRVLTRDENEAVDRAGVPIRRIDGRDYSENEKNLMRAAIIGVRDTWGVA